MAHVRQSSTSTLQDLFNGIKNTSRQGVLTPEIEFWVFGSPEGLPKSPFQECECHPHTPSKWGCDRWGELRSGCSLLQYLGLCRVDPFLLPLGFVILFLHNYLGHRHGEAFVADGFSFGRIEASLGAYSGCANFSQFLLICLCPIEGQRWSLSSLPPFRSRRRVCRLLCSLPGSLVCW